MTQTKEGPVLLCYDNYLKQNYLKQKHVCVTKILGYLDKRCFVDLFAEVGILALLKTRLAYKIKGILTFYNPAILSCLFYAIVCN